MANGSTKRREPELDNTMALTGIRRTVTKKKLSPADRILEMENRSLYAVFKDKMEAVAPKLQDYGDFRRIMEWARKPENAAVVEAFTYKLLEKIEPAEASAGYGSGKRSLHYNSNQLYSDILIRPFIDMAMQKPGEFLALTARVESYDEQTDVVSFMDNIHNQILAYVDGIAGLPTREKYMVLANLIYDPQPLVGYANEAHSKNNQVGGDGVDLIKDLFLGPQKNGEAGRWKLEKPKEEPAIA